MVIDTRNDEPELMNARKWPARKGSMEVMTGRTLHYHGMGHKAMRTRTYVLQRFWRDHISDKTVAEVIYRQMHLQCQRMRSPTR